MVLGCRRAGNDVRIEVWDIGKGIPHDRHEEIFQEFYQLDNPERAAFDLSHCLVLVIDDEAAVQEGMATLLRMWKCDVLTAGSCAEMKSKLVELQRLPDLIVSDFRLCGAENGIQVVEMLRSEFNLDIPALLVTGDTAPDRLRDAEASGLPILHKPLNPARLRILIANLLREYTRAA